MSSLSADVAYPPEDARRQPGVSAYRWAVLHSDDGPRWLQCALPDVDGLAVGCRVSITGAGPMVLAEGEWTVDELSEPREHQYADRNPWGD